MKNRTFIYIVILAVLSVVALYLYGIINKNSELEKVSSLKNEKSLNSTLETQLSEGEITVEVTPKTLTKGSPATFDISFTTHSGNPQYDLLSGSSLTDDLGNGYEPLSWDGPKEGHHAQGLLTFPAIDKSANKIVLTILNIGDERKFSWEIKQ